MDVSMGKKNGLPRNKRKGKNDVVHREKERNFFLERVRGVMGGRRQGKK